MINIYCNPILENILQERNISYNPAYGGESTGLDLYCTSTEPIVLIAQEVLVPTGLHIALPSSHTALILGRGSIHKTSLIHRAGVIDPGYAGEIFISALNLGSNDVTIKPGDKLPWQLVVFQTPNDFNVVDKESFDQLHLNSQRKSGKLGSSN